MRRVAVGAVVWAAPAVWVATFLEEKLDAAVPRLVGWLDLRAGWG